MDRQKDLLSCVLLPSKKKKKRLFFMDSVFLEGFVVLFMVLRKKLD